MSVAAVGALERGTRRAPHRETVWLLAEALAVSPEDRGELESAAERARGRRQRRDVQGVPKHNLPTRLTSFLGRQDEIAKIEELLRTSRLVTLTGSGGVGKTRMAIETARDLLEQRQYEEAWFVDLSPLRDASFVAGAIAAALSLPTPPLADPLPSLAASLKSRPRLLILDNCEHLIDVVAQTAGALLQDCPDLEILATSREQLAIDGEHVHRLPSLAVPIATPSTADEARTFASFQLFLDRAAAVGPMLPLSGDQLKIGAEICRRLEGIPLAIELAASRVPSLGFEVLEKRLSDHLAIAGTRRDLPHRQRTMTATVEWSYDLLSASERALLRHLAVFRGGATIEAVESICADQSLTRNDILDLLSSLVYKSLLTMTNDDERPRYFMLEVVRAFSLKNLDEAGELERATRAHLRWMASVAERANEQVGRVSQYAWHREFGVELGNARDALARALEAGNADDAVLAGRIVGGLRLLWLLTERHGECRRWCEAALARIDEEQHPVVAASLLRAYVQASQGCEMLAVADRAFRVFERVGDRQGLIFLHAQVAWERSNSGDFPLAEDAIARAFALAADVVLSVREELILLKLRWNTRIRAGKLEEAQYDLQRQAQLVQQLGDESESLMLRYSEGCAEFAAGNYERAVDLLELSLQLTAGGERRGLRKLLDVAAARLALGQLRSAENILCDAMDRLAEARPDTVWVAVLHLATLRALQGNVRSAARLAGFIQAWGAQNDRVPDIFGRSSMAILEDVLRRELAAPTAAALAAQGSTIGLHQAVAEALA